MHSVRREAFERVGLCLLLGLVALLAAACSSSPAPTIIDDSARPEPLSGPETTYLLNPAEGFPSSLEADPDAGPVDPSAQAEVSAAYEGMVLRSNVSGAEQVANDLLAADPSFAPAAVLAAQVAFLRGDDARAREWVEPVAVRYEGYPAAQLLLGRISEKLGDLVTAYGAYRNVAAEVPVAAERIRELYPRTVQVLRLRVEDALARDRVPDAEEQLARLQAWAPEEDATLESAWEVARARGDAVAELKALAPLAERFGNRPELLERRADLELEVGDPGTSLEIYTALLEASPGDPALGRKLDRAKFFWRLNLLPEAVRRRAGEAQIRRGSYASLLYWLVPDVRYARRSTSPKIANDILEEPNRNEIARVINMGLIPVDSTRHQFQPGAPLTRYTALRSLLKILATSPGGAPACLAGGEVGSGNDQVCTAAKDCGLLGPEAPCEPRASLSGGQAVELIRRALTQQQ